MRQDRRETHVRRSLNDRKLPESERSAGKELGLDAEGDVQAWSGGQSRGVVGILRHERGGCKNELWRRNGE